MPTTRRDLVLNLLLGAVVIAGLVVASMFTELEDTGFALALGGALTLGVVVMGLLAIRFPARRR